MDLTRSTCRGAYVLLVALLLTLIVAPHVAAETTGPYQSVVIEPEDGVTLSWNEHHYAGSLEVTAASDGLVVLDHLGKPSIRRGEMEPWRSAIKNLAGCSNVWCKLSGMVTEADHRHWQYRDLLPYMEVVVKAFGPGRVMLGSDWPVCRLAAEYMEVMAVTTKYIETFDKADREKILYQNAVECSQLNTELNGEAKI